MNAIVTNASQAYGYKYASLADFVRQGHSLPRMRTRVLDNGAEFVEYLTKEGTWEQGARVVIPLSKQMNEAQAYGAGLTYARRYTVAMALGLATDDDNAVERRASAGQPARPPQNVTSFTAQASVRRPPQNVRNATRNQTP